MLYKTQYKLFVLILFLVSVSQLTAQQKGYEPEDILRTKFVIETAQSPDGNFIAYTVFTPRPFTDKPGADYRYLYVYDVKNNSSKELIGDQSSVFGISWMPDSKSILFRAKLGDVKNVQLLSITASGGTPKVLIDTENGVLDYQLSKDGQKIAYISTDSQPSAKKELLEKGFDAEIYEEENVDRNLFVYDVKDKSTQKLTTAVSAWEFTWNDQGTEIAAAVSDKNQVDDSYMFKRIFIVNASNGVKTKLVENPGKLSNLSFSPDGRHLAFVSAANTNDAVSGSLFIAEVPNTKPFEELRNYSKGFRGSVVDVVWKDNNTVLFSSEEGVDITLREQEIDGAESKLLLEPAKVVFTSFHYSKGKFSFSGNTSNHPGELFTFDVSKNELKKLTNINPWFSDIKLAKQEKIIYYARDGLDIEAVLIYPLNFEEGKRYPLITHIHGGPEAAEQNGWATGYNKWGQVAAAKDYFVFMPNYRASSGRGVEFTMMGFGDLAGKEFDDVIDGIDFLIKKGYVDKNKVGIGGGSYGGYFSAWASTKHTDRFAASVVFVGIGNQISKRFTTDIPYEDYHVHWGIWTFENEEIIWERSPVRYAHLSKTPTLVLHGKEDPRVHPSQGLELYRALKTHSKAPVRLVLYPGQGHGNSKNTARYDYLVRTMDWFDYYLKSNKPKDKMPDKYPALKF
ncbi:MAG: S9 family peptidase [Ignavibacterium sp.]|nr:S9 family peptidase [Ignavibacterium sp.]